MKPFVLALLICLSAMNPAEAGKKTPPPPEPEKVGTYQAVRRIASHVDRSWVDPAIISTCTTTGAFYGKKMMSFVLGYVWQAQGRRFQPDDHWEDEMGHLLGGVLGYHTGRVIVFLRHRVTDVVFPGIADFVGATCHAGQQWTIQKCDNFGGWCSGWLQRLSASFRRYGATRD